MIRKLKDKGRGGVRQARDEKNKIELKKDTKKNQRKNKRELEKGEEIVGERNESERCGGKEETSREKQRR